MSDRDNKEDVGRMDFLLTLRRRGISDKAVLRAIDEDAEDDPDPPARLLHAALLRPERRSLQSHIAPRSGPGRQLE